MTRPDPTQLPHLLALVDDDSAFVVRTVLAKLREFGDELAQELERLEPPPSRERIAALVEQVQAGEQAEGGNAEGGVTHGEAGGEALFRPGDLVRHRRYGYRGVVVDFDPVCRASEEWYARNRTQPDRDQPWYHVLVHGSTMVTYAAQASLMADECGEEIEHGMLPVFFDRFESHRYIRNETEWPGFA